MRVALLLVLVAAGLTACGGDTLAVDPVAQAADTTAKAGSEHVEFLGVSTVQGQKIRMTGSGDFRNDPQLGRMTLRFTGGTTTGEITEVMKGWRIYMTSPLFARQLPQGKTWMSLDLQKAGKAAGIDFSSLSAQTPGQTLEQLKASGDVTKVGTETLDGVETTHYTATLDPGQDPERRAAAEADRRLLPARRRLDRFRRPRQALAHRVLDVGLRSSRCRREQRDDDDLLRLWEDRRCVGPDRRGDLRRDRRGGEVDAAERRRIVQVALKVWRFNSRSGERELQEFEIDAPEEATLLDCLDIVKDKHDGTLAYRKSCRMMICGSCGMRMDGAAVLACKTRMYEIANAGHIPVISAMGNLPIVKDLVVDMDPFWEKFNSVNPYLQPGYEEPPDGKEHLIRQERMNVIHKEALCINCGCCVSECNAMESDPRFVGPQALAKAMRFVGDPRDSQKLARLEKLNDEHGIWECTRCYFCNERCPKGVDPRDAIAKLGAESMKEGIDRDMGAKHAKWFVVSAKTTGWLRETELVPKTQGVVSAIKQTKFAMGLAAKGKVPLPFPPHVAKNVQEARRLHDLVRDQGVDGYAAIVQGEHALAKLSHGDVTGATLDEIYDRPGAFHRPYLQEDEVPSGSEGGMGALNQADTTPGEQPTAMYGDNQPGQGDDEVETNP